MLTTHPPNQARVVLRHSCGYALADKGADARLILGYFGHRDTPHGALHAHGG